MNRRPTDLFQTPQSPAKPRNSMRWRAEHSVSGIPTSGGTFPAFTIALLAAIAILSALPRSAALAADLPSTIRTATDMSPASSSAATVHTYVADQVKKLQGDDAKAASEARVSLVGEVLTGGTPPSGAFLDFYGGELKDQLTLLMASPNVRVRLNVAIITAKVAKETTDARLTALAIKQLQDANEGVALWGMKAAYYLIPPALNVGGSGKALIPTVLATAERLGTGPIVHAAYDALAGDPKTNGPVVTTVVGPMQDLLAWRVDQYAKGIPAEPSADTLATSFLIGRAVWNKQTKPQQTRTVQLIVSLIGSASVNVPTIAPADRDMLITLLSKAAGGLSVVGHNTNDDPLVAALTDLGKITNRTPDAAIVAAVSPIYAAVAVKWPSVVPPKGQATTTTAPTTTDTTSGSPPADAPN